MFSLTAKANYGIGAILELAKNQGRGLLQIKDLVGNGSIPKNFLEQVLNQLTKAGIVRSVRGNRGGFELATESSQITLLQVLQVLDGKIERSTYAGPAAVRDLLTKVEEQISSSLDVSFQEILERQRSFDEQMVFFI